MDPLLVKLQVLLEEGSLGARRSIGGVVLRAHIITRINRLSLALNEMGNVLSNEGGPTCVTAQRQ